jgi:hypothetical protein
MWRTSHLSHYPLHVVVKTVQLALDAPIIFPVLPPHVIEPPVKVRA